MKQPLYTVPKKRIALFSLLLFTLLISTFFSCSQKIYHEANVQQLPPTEYLKELEAHPEAYLLDIRTGFEYRRNHLERAKNISYLSGSFSKKITKLDTTKTVFIYCETAHRSPMAARKLWKKGFHQIIDLKGGHKQLRKMNRNLN